MIITIDGYSATGKSTIASKLAQEIGFQHLNSGLIYRTISYYLNSNGIFLYNYMNQIKIIKSLLNDFELTEMKVDITILKSKDIGIFGTKIAQIDFIRDVANSIQKDVASKNNTIIDGRDAGTVVFPNADFKFFFVADINIRAERIANERKENNIELIKEELIDRDKEDIYRKIAPLKKPKNAIEIDTSFLSIEEIINNMRKTLIRNN
ncbi:MAG: (d)CMP kinase [Leptospiraceae bacterium]|nr:(d)CMP kinase [Leptospiraceae bacterium]